MAEPTYGRGQVEWALWRNFGRAFHNRTDVPKIFRTRIKRLMELDRSLDLSDVEVLPDADYAFTPPSGDSGEAAYRAVDAFCLAIALDLLDSGFKQSEIVFLLRYMRADLQRRFPRLLKRPSLVDRQPHRAKDHPELPVFLYQGNEFADAREFVVLQQIELTELVPQAKKKGSKHPIILEPIYCSGIADLDEKLVDLMPYRRRAVTIVELTGTAQSVQQFLGEAPDIRRGRPSKR